MKTIVLLLIFNLLLSCSSSEMKSTTENGMGNQKLDSINFQKNHDLSINDELKLRDPKSIESTLGDISEKLIIPYNEAPYVLLRNKTRQEYLKMIMWYGDAKNTFSYFIVGNIDSTMDTLNYISTNYQSFQTNKGINLGDSKSDVLNQKGKNYIKTIVDTEEIIRYSNGELYESIYYFNNDVLTKFAFGFRYP